MRARKWAATVGGAVALAIMWCAIAPGTGSATRAVPPVVEGPVEGGSHGFAFTPSAIDLGPHGYTEREYFVSGSAQAYEHRGEWTTDGRWDASRTTTAPYTTRILVRRPSNPKQFNGTVVVEWLNVSSGIDIDVDFGYVGDEILRGGYAWVGVSAQAAGITSTGGGGLNLGPGAVGLRNWDPERYGSLEHPGDAYSYDIFSQVGRFLRKPGAANPLRGLRVKQLLADGESQSAFRMLTYVNAVHPDAGVYDGFLIHSRNGGGAPLDDGARGPVDAARVRTDLDAPVFQVETETDMFDIGAPFPPARQPDTARVRTWELAGTAHADARYLRLLYAQGTKSIDGMLDLTGVFDVANNGPQQYVMCAALRALRTWAAGKGVPPRSDPLEITDGTIARDEHGNARGGVRTPQVDAPVATLTGQEVRLIGRTVPFDKATLAELYPTHGAFVAAFNRAADRAVKDGFLLARDARDMKADAAASAVGGA